MHEFLSPEEIKQLNKRSNARAFWEIAYNWLWIVAAFAMVYFFPNVFTIVLAAFVMGGKQLGCAIIMHDAGHHSLFTSKKLNEFFGQWFGAFPIFMNVHAYAQYHLEHHLFTGLEKDPDTSLVKAYPAKLISMLRKIARDLLGVTGVKSLIGLMLMHGEWYHFELSGELHKNESVHYSFSQRVIVLLKNLAGPLFVNFIIFVICLLLGKWYLYFLWLGSFLTTFQFCIRIRAIAEHGLVQDPSNPKLNTRTTYANFIEKLFFAPLQVNFHAEHHLMMSVPCYRLRAMHRLLKTKGYFDEAPLAQNYWQVFRSGIK